MSMVCGLDLHRRQITSDAVEVESGESWRGRVWQPDHERFRRWLRDDVTRRAQGAPVALAVEGCTGWRYVVEEITAAASRPIWPSRPTPRRRRASSLTPRRSRRQRCLEWRERVRLYKSLVDQRTVWCDRIDAELY